MTRHCELISEKVRMLRERPPAAHTIAGKHDRPLCTIISNYQYNVIVDEFIINMAHFIRSASDGISRPLAKCCLLLAPLSEEALTR